MKQITVDAYSKVNLALDVLGRLPNGYHEVHMIMQQLQLKDRITVKKTGSGRREIILTTDKDGVPLDYRNLAFQAAQLMLGLEELTEGVHIHIEKHIPIAAGMAGGSADCAAVFIAMNELFDMKLSTASLCRLGAKLGADIPFCIMGGTAVAAGTGTNITKIKGLNPEKYFVLVCKPSQGMSTGAVYAKYSERAGEMILRKHPDIIRLVGGLTSDSGLEILKKDMINVLQYVTAEELTEIKEIIYIMERKGAEHAMMTGSGPAVFGIFRDSQKVAEAYMELAEIYEETYITGFR